MLHYQLSENACIPAEFTITVFSLSFSIEIINEKSSAERTENPRLAGLIVHYCIYSLYCPPIPT